MQRLEARERYREMRGLPPEVPPGELGARGARGGAGTCQPTSPLGDGVC